MSKLVTWGLLVLGVVTVAIVSYRPVSWWVEQPASILVGQWESGSACGGFWAYPKASVQPLNGNLEHDLTMLVWRDSGDDLEKVREIALKMDNAAGYAAVLRSYFQWHGIGMPTDEKKPTAERIEKLRAAIGLAERGAGKDRGNAYFPLLMAAAYQGVGDLGKRDLALRDAARCSEYRSYLLDQMDMQEKVGLAIHGYRGEYVRRMERMESSVGDIVAYRGLGRWLREPEAPDPVRLDYVRAMAVVYRHARDYSALNAAERTILMHFQPKGDMTRDEKQRQAEARVRRLDPSLVPLMQKIAKADADKDLGTWWSPSLFDPGTPTFFAAGLLGSVAIVMLLAVVGWAMSRLRWENPLARTRKRPLERLSFWAWAALAAMAWVGGLMLMTSFFWGTLDVGTVVLAFLSFIAVMLVIGPLWQGCSLRAFGSQTLRAVPGLLLLTWAAYLGTCLVDVSENRAWGRFFDEEDQGPVVSLHGASGL